MRANLAQPRAELFPQSSHLEPLSKRQSVVVSLRAPPNGITGPPRIAWCRSSLFDVVLVAHSSHCHHLNMKQRTSRTVRLFEVIILRPCSVGFLIAAVVCFLLRAWVDGVAMTVCWFFVGTIGQALPHRKPLTVPELAIGSALPPVEELSHEDAIALGKATLRIGLVIGVAAFILALKSELRWYWVLVWAIGSYFVTVMIGAFLPTSLSARKARVVRK